MSESRSMQGLLLVASPALEDPNFHRAVVLLVQHDEDGAMGLILNRPTESMLGDLWPQVSDLPCELEAALHQGGPCEGPLMLLHAEQDLGERSVLPPGGWSMKLGSKPIKPMEGDEANEPGVWFSAEEGHVRTVVEQGIEPAKCFVGYAGWGAGQLENELIQEGWLVAPATAGLVFQTPEDAWETLMKQISRSRATAGMNWRSVPRDPSQN